MAKKAGTILIVDDDEDVLITAKMILRNEFDKIITESSPKKLERLLETERIDVILLDMNFKTGATSGNEGLFWLRRIKALAPEIEIIMNTAYGDIQLAVDCMKEGAIDFMIKPWEKEKLLTTIKNIFQITQSKKKIHQLEAAEQVLVDDLASSLGEMLGQSAAMKQVFETIQKVANTDANVLILGENGTGKELVARAIHQMSARKTKRFVKVDLGALSDSLFESELFGHEKGAFTDAKADREGRFVLAHEGTLFLDEIGNISAQHQIKLLTVLQNRQVTKLGSNKSANINIRLIAATNADIMAMVSENRFRQDLLYRINTIEINLPPLRKRDGDIKLLALHFMHQYGQKYNKGNLQLPDQTIKKLENYHWPGNIRELQHAVERAVIMSENNVLQPEDFLMKSTGITTSDQSSLKVEDVEKMAVVQAIETYENNLTAAAKALGMGRSTLYRKMKKYGLE